MSNSHKYIDKKWKNGRWIYYYPQQQKPHERFNPNNIDLRRTSWRNDDLGSIATYTDGFGNKKTIEQTFNGRDRNIAGIRQNENIKDKRKEHYAQYLKERETYVDRRNRAGKLQNRSGEAVKASYKTTPVSKIKSTFRKISSRLGSIKLSSIFK